MFLLCWGSLHGVPAVACVTAVAGFPVFSTISCAYVADIVPSIAGVSAVGGLPFFAGFPTFVRAPVIAGVLQLLTSLLLLASLRLQMSLSSLL